MAAPIFDTGVFIIMAIVAFGTLFVSSKVGYSLLLLSATLFLVLGLVLVTGNDVVSYKTTTDGTTWLNETNYFITNSMSTPTTQWLGWIMFVFAIISGGKFIADITDGTKNFI